MPLNRLTWAILFTIWVAGFPAGFVASAYGVEIPPLAYIAYSSISAFITASHPAVTRVVRRIDEERQRAADGDDR